MKLSTLEDHTIKFEEIYNPIIIESNEGETITLQQRDSGFELCYSAKGKYPQRIECKLGQVTTILDKTIGKTK